ncbi:glycosyltransferase [Chloroflexota bacterium]
MPFRIAFLSKYPPIEGGIATKTYWFTRGLVARGHDIHIITHGLPAGGEYSVHRSERQPENMPNLRIHSPQEQIPWHIPEDEEHALTLLNLTMEVIKEHDIQILDSGYFVPYGIVGHLAKKSTGVYHVIRHGGSDIEKFFKKGLLRGVITEAITQADILITESRYQALFEPLTSRLVFQPAYVPDGEVFIQRNDSEPRGRIAFIGKINYHWQHKNLHLIAGIMRQLTGQFECWLVGQGKGIADFSQSLGPETVAGFKWYPFVAPWAMPQLLNQLDAIFIFESGLPHPVVSNLALEAISSGVGIITDRGDFIETYRDIVEIDKNQVIVISPSEPSSATEMIEPWVRERACNIQSSHPLVSYQEYLSANESIYANILGGH